MATKDYAPNVALARKLLLKFGDPRVFQKLNETPSDPAAPWRGPVDSATPVAEEQTLQAVAVEPSSVVRLGIATEDEDFVKRASVILIVEPEASGNPIDDYDAVVYEGHCYRIQDVRKLRPASTTILYYVSMRR